MPRPISEIDLSEVLYYDETINGVKQAVAYWPIRKDADGVVLLRANVLDETRRMNETNEATYIGSLMDTWLNDASGGYLSYFDEKMRACIIPSTVKIKPYNSDAVTEIARQVYLLSASEVTNGGLEGESILPMLKVHTGKTDDLSARIAFTIAGSVVHWWLRSFASSNAFRFVNANGYVYSYSASGLSSPRPVFKVANATMVSDGTAADKKYILPDPEHLYRELSFTAFLGSTAKRPKRAKVQVEITHALEKTIHISNNAKDANPVWVPCEPDQVLELANTSKETASWELGVKVYAKSEGRATCNEPVAIVEVE